jgi:hypothetical protein
MPIKVDLVKDGRVVRIQCDGPISRQEVGWAAERARELLGEDQVSAVFVDATRAELPGSASLTGEMTENFLLALETNLPIAYVRPSSWSSEYVSEVRSRVTDIPDSARVCATTDEAIAWLRRLVTPNPSAR